MEDTIRKELNELCLTILKDIHSHNVTEFLPQVQSMQEKLILLKYLSFREKQLKTPESKAATPDISEKLDEELEQTLQKAHSDQAQQGAPAPVNEKQVAEPRLAAPGTPDETPAKEAPQQEAPAAKAVEPKPSEAPVSEEHLTQDNTPAEVPAAPQREHETPAPKSPKMVAGPITLGLNDRISFTNHLFEGSQEDLNRVISQVNTLQTYPEAVNFIQNMVKPDYDWSNKLEYEERLFDLLKARFGEG